MPDKGDPQQAPVHIEGHEHRLAAILVGDVVGYTKLIAEDEDHAVRTLAAYRQEIELLVGQHRGRLVDFAAGDGFLAEFPSALYAVRCALEIQDVLRARNTRLREDKRVEFRLGAHVGDIRIEGERIVGSGVNIAARLEPLAAPGGLCVSDRVRDDIRGRIDLTFESLGPQALKNVPEPVHAYRVPLPPAAARTEKILAGSRSRWQLAFVAGAITAILAAGWWFGVRDETLEPRGAIRSIAVLPFQSFSGDPEQEYFADGITDALITELGQLTELDVISRTSTMRYKSSEQSLPEIASELGVDVVLEGAVGRSTDRVRVTAQLIQATTDHQLWSESYDRSLRDILTLQSEIATSVVQEIEAELRPQASPPVAPSRVVDPEVHEAYLKGRYIFRNTTSEERFRAAIDYITRSIELDPSFAPSYAAIADVYLVQGFSGFVRPRDVIPEAKAAALRATQLDDTLGDAHRSLAWIHVLFDWDLPAAEREVLRALELNPNDALAHNIHGLFHSASQRYEEAISHRLRAQELDPLFLNFRTAMAGDLVDQGRYDETIELCQMVLDLSPDHLWASFHMWRALYGKGAYEAAYGESQRFFSLRGNQQVVTALQAGYSASGYRGAMLKAADTLVAQSEDRSVSPLHIALLYAQAREVERTFEWLENAYTERDPLLILIPGTPAFRPLHSDPRYAHLLTRLGLTPSTEESSHATSTGQNS